MFKPFENCNSIEEIANNAAKKERINLKRDYAKNNSRNIFEIDTMYRFNYANKNMELQENIIAQVEYTKKQWEENKQKGMSYKYSNQKLRKNIIDNGIDHIATVSHYILRVARDMSELTQTPTFIIYNARAATIYSHILDDNSEIFYKSGITKKINASVLNIEKVAKSFQTGNIKWCVVPIRDMKISSHQYVQTQEEAEKLGKKGISNLLRYNFNDVACMVNEHIPDIFIKCLRHKCGVIFVDIPTWGVGYASSAGLFRKQKDIDKRNRGIYSPFKFKSYVEFANYQVASFSMSKYWNSKPQIEIEEENFSRIDITQPIALILNPEVNQSVWWDDCPQFHEYRWKKFSDSSMNWEPLHIETSLGKMDIARYIIDKIKGAVKEDELSLY